MFLSEVLVVYKNYILHAKNNKKFFTYSNDEESIFTGQISEIYSPVAAAFCF
jgi:hypothetical protein